MPSKFRILLVSLLLPLSCTAQELQQAGRFLMLSDFIDYSERREIIRVLEYVLGNHGYALADTIGRNTPRMAHVYYMSYEPEDAAHGVQNIDIRLSYETLRLAFNSNQPGDSHDLAPVFKDLKTRLKSRIPSATILTWNSRTEKRDGFTVGRRKFVPEDFAKPVITDPEATDDDT